MFYKVELWPATNLRVETVPAFRYIKHAVISSNPEGDAIDRVFSIARSCGVETPRVIGWDFPNVSQEQINVFNMHGYEAAWILPDGITPPDLEIHEQADHKYAAIHIESPFENPFVTIPNGYKTLMEYMRVNGLEHHLIAEHLHQTQNKQDDHKQPCKS